MINTSRTETTDNTTGKTIITTLEEHEGSFFTEPYVREIVTEVTPGILFDTKTTLRDTTTKVK